MGARDLVRRRGEARRAARRPDDVPARQPDPRLEAHRAPTTVSIALADAEPGRSRWRASARSSSSPTSGLQLIANARLIPGASAEVVGRGPDGRAGAHVGGRHDRPRRRRRADVCECRLAHGGVLPHHVLARASRPRSCVAIVFAYLNKIGRRDLFSPVWLGVLGPCCRPSSSHGHARVSSGESASVAASRCHGGMHAGDLDRRRAVQGDSSRRRQSGCRRRALVRLAAGHEQRSSATRPRRATCSRCRRRISDRFSASSSRCARPIRHFGSVLASCR